MTDHRPQTNEPLSEALPGLLKERGLSMRQLAERTGVSSSHLSRLVSGKTYVRSGNGYARPATVSPDLARRIAQALELPEGYFPEVREAEAIQRIRSDPKLRDEIYRGKLGR